MHKNQNEEGRIERESVCSKFTDLLVQYFSNQFCDISTVTKIQPQTINIIRRGKLNSQFIITKFSILHAGRQLLFIFYIGGMS